MKKLLLTSLLFLSMQIAAQEPAVEPDQDSLVTAAYNKYLAYKPCMTCGENWKEGGSAYKPTTQRSDSQRRILDENNAASRTVSRGTQIFRGVITVIVAAAIGTLTYTLITKTNNSVNELVK